MKLRKMCMLLMSGVVAFCMNACSQTVVDEGGVIFPKTNGTEEKETAAENVKDCSSAPTGVPEYENSGLKFDVNGFCIPHSKVLITDEAVKDIADAGLTAIIIDPWGGFTYETEAGLEKMDILFRLLEKYGLEGYVSTNNGYEVRGNGAQFGGDNHWHSIADINYDFTQYSAFKGIMAFDEPGGSFGNTENEETNDFAFLEREFEIWKGKWEDPDGDGPEEAVFKNGKYTDYRFFVNGCGDKRNVLDPLVERIYPMLAEDGESEVIVSLDTYPFKYDQTSQKASLNESYLYNFEMFADYARENGYPFWNYIETTDIYNSGRTPDDMLGEEEMLFQIGSMFAYGAKGIGLFTYATAGTMKGLVDTNNVKYDSYYYVQKTLSEVHEFANVYLNFDYLGYSTLVGTKNALGYCDAFDLLEYNDYSSDRIRKISATRDTLLGCFKDKNGYDGYIIQNYHDPYYRKSDDVSITFNNATKAVVYSFENGALKREVKTLTDGTLDLRITFGKFVFVIPVV